MVLHHSPIGVMDNFFASGGDSILVIQVVSRANQAGLTLSVKDLFTAQTIAGLALLVGQQKNNLILERYTTGVVPLVPIQQWFFDMCHSYASYWNQAVLLRIEESLDEKLLAQAFNAVFAAHPSLYLHYQIAINGQVTQSYSPISSVAIEKVELTQMGEDEQQRELNQLLNQAQNSLDIENGALFKILWVHGFIDQSSRLLIVIHHLAVDGVSWRILLEDLELAYRQCKQNQTPMIQAEITTYKDWSLALQREAERLLASDEKDFWFNQVRAPRLPIDGTGGENTFEEAKTLSISFSEAETSALLTEVHRAYHTQINDILLVALLLALNQWTKQTSFTIHLEGHGREEIEQGIDTHRTIGWFTSLFPVTLTLDTKEVESEDAFKGVIISVKEQLRAIPNKGLGYGILKYLAKLNEKTSYLFNTEAIADINFNYLGQFDDTSDETKQRPLFKFASESAGQMVHGQNRRSALLDISGADCLRTIAFFPQLQSTISSGKYGRSIAKRISRKFKKIDSTLQEAICIYLHCFGFPIG